ncbi:hypothetical protein [Synechococcus sp. HK01-R]|uniref:hypothetical protein n=1 Tax=Synechococcus sp. HK01-R TaxID=2751171 RepID=UPI002105D749|nr:hypothetical protein [Synechococcus sp. HK01-R]
MLRVLQALQTAVAVVAFTPAVLQGGAAQAQSPLGGYQTQQEKEIYNTVPGNRDGGSPLDATNPMDLMNRLRQATSMNDATDPADAIDAALKGYATENPAAGPSMRP